jgi:Family of unknown function (DUF6496)
MSRTVQQEMKIDFSEELGKLSKRSTVFVGTCMARKAKKRKYSKSSGSDVKNEMHRYKKGTAKSGRGGKGGRVKSRKQAIAIGLSKARKKGKKVPTRKKS